MDRLPAYENPQAERGVMMRILKAFLLANVLTIVLSGCANFGAGTIYRESWAPLFNHRELMVRHANRDMRLTVQNAPNGWDRDAYAEDLAKAMYGHNAGLPINFTETPTGEAAELSTRIVVQANAVPSRSGRALCVDGDTIEALVSPAEAPELLFAYCKADRNLSSLRIRLTPDAMPGSTSFHTAIAAATARLLPTADPTNAAMGCQQEC